MKHGVRSKLICKPMTPEIYILFSTSWLLNRGCVSRRADIW